MNLYRFEIRAFVLVEAVNVVQASKVCKDSVKVIGNRCGWRNSKQGALPYSVEVENPIRFTQPKRIKP